MISNYKEELYNHETLDAEHIILRKFRLADAADVLEYGSDEKTLEYLVWNGVTTLAEATASIVDYYWSRPGIYAIALKENQKCIGCIDLCVVPDHDKGSFGYVLNRQYWGKGYMREALSAMLSLCFETLLLNRVESTHLVGNEASGKVMQKCGMVLEGVGRQELVVKGVFRDIAHYAVTRERWLSDNKN